MHGNYSGILDTYTGISGRAFLRYYLVWRGVRTWRVRRIMEKEGETLGCGLAVKIPASSETKELTPALSLAFLFIGSRIDCGFLKGILG